MPSMDPVADFLTRIRNAQKAKHPTVDVPSSRMKEQIAQIMVKEGFIRNFQVVQNTDNAGKTLRLELKYDRSGRPMIRTIERVSKSGCRRYASIEKLIASKDVVTTTIVSTSRGIMTDQEACASNVGGEVICRIS